MPLLKAIIESRGSQLKRVLSGDIGVIKHALEVRGSLVQEVSTSNLADLLRLADKVKPEALTKIKFELHSKNEPRYFFGGSIRIEPNNMNGGSLLSRICELRIDFDTVTKYRDSCVLLMIAKFIKFAVQSFEGLKKVTVRYQNSYTWVDHTKPSLVLRLFRVKLQPQLLCKPHSKIKDTDNFWEVDIMKKDNHTLSDKEAKDHLEKLIKFLVKL